MTIILLSLFSFSSFAGELAKGTAAYGAVTTVVASQASVELGGCKPHVDARTKTEEQFARNEAEKSGLSKEELLARLIYSEALSTGYWKNACKAKSESDIMKSIGWGIMNRVKSKARSSLDAYSDVIFDKNQFRTSFSGKKSNPFAEAFLCPLKSQKYLDKTSRKPTATTLYKKAQVLATEIVSEFEKNGIPQSYRGITNFFYPHSEFFGELRPTWAPAKIPTKNKGYVNTLGVNDKPCVESYRLR